MTETYRYAAAAELDHSADRAVAASLVDAAEGPDRRRVLDAIDAHEDIADRGCRPGHLTGSAMVIDPETRLGLLLHHTKLRMWLQPGGHADGDTNLARVALREASEETGIDGLGVIVPAIDVDIHRVEPPGEDPHLHLDVRFVVVAPPDAELAGNHESTDMRWVTLAELRDLAPEPGLIRLAIRAFEVIDRLSAG